MEQKEDLCRSSWRILFFNEKLLLDLIVKPKAELSITLKFVIAFIISFYLMASS